MQTLITEFVVTEKCNLACEYCYMKNNPKHMDKAGVDHFIQNVQKFMDAYGCGKYHISYFGGEPLVNWETVKYGIKQFKNDPRCESQVIISNGLLLDQEKVDYIKSHNIGFSWSFDGIWQDDQRPHLFIKDTLAVYKSKIDIINQVSRHHCKVMVSPSNFDTMADNYRFLVQEYDREPDFALVRDDIWSDEDCEKFTEALKPLNEAILDFAEQGRVVLPGFYSLALLDMLAGKNFGKRPYSCFAGCNGVGYFPSKEFYPCARFGTSKEFCLADAEGNLIQENINFLRQRHFVDPSTYQDCIDCKLYNYCNSGCFYSQFKFDGDKYVAGPVPNLCKLFKTIYENTLHIHSSLKYNKHYTEYLEIITRPFFGSKHE